jgi:hypothetical protein
MANNIMTIVVVVIMMINNSQDVSAACARTCAELRALEANCVPGYLCYVPACSRILRCSRRGRSRSRSLQNITAPDAVVSNKTLVVDCLLPAHRSCEIVGEAFKIKNTDFTFVNFNFKEKNGDPLKLVGGNKSSSVVSFEDCIFTSKNGTVIPLPESELTPEGVNSTEPIQEAAEDYLLSWTV